MLKSWRGNMVLVLGMLAGCAEYRGNWFGGPSLTPPLDYYQRSDLDELLRFGADLAGRSASSRARECRRLIGLQRNRPSIGVQLHLMTGRLLSESCGDARRIADSVKSIPRSKLPDERTQWLIATQTEALKRFAGGSLGGGGSSSGKKSAVAPAAEPKAKSKPDTATDTGKDDAQILRQKLEAIRSIERKMDKEAEH